MSYPKIAIIVLNWNGWQDTIECLGSLAKIDYPDYQLIVVDNGSTDDSVSRIKQWAADSLPVIKLLELKENLGYAKGNNEGIRYAAKDKDVEYILILNNDTVVKKDFLGKLMEGFDAGDNVALVGPKILDHKSGSFQPTAQTGRLNLLSCILYCTPLKAFAINNPLRRIFPRNDGRTRKVYAISGSCMLFRKAALIEIRMFDENTFLGWEEYIIAEKLNKKGYRTNYDGGSEIYHKWGRSTKKMESAAKAIAFIKSGNYFIENYLRMPTYQISILRLTQLLIYSIICSFNGSYRRNYPDLVRAILNRQANCGKR